FALYQTHGSVRRDEQQLVIAEVRDVRADGVGHLYDHLPFFRGERFAVDLEIQHVVRHATASAIWPSTMLRPPCSTMYSNSCRKCLVLHRSRHAGASASGPNGWPT